VSFLEEADNDALAVHVAAALVAAFELLDRTGSRPNEQ
jgi:hypothetical protein